MWTRKQIKDGRKNLGAALGSRTFTEEYVSKQVQKWIDKVNLLATIAQCSICGLCPWPHR